GRRRWCAFCQRLEGHQRRLARGRARELRGAGDPDRRRSRQGSGLPAARLAGLARRRTRGVDRRRRAPHRCRVARGSQVSRRRHGRRRRRRVPRSAAAPRRAWCAGRSAVAGLRVVRHVPRLRGPRSSLQGRGRAAACSGGGDVNRGDRWLLVLPLALTAIGVIMVYSSSAILGITRFHDPNYFLLRQLARAAIGVAVLLIAARADLRRLESLAPIVLGSAIALLLLVIV